MSLAIAPFLFNPHQFSFSDFIIDYRELLRWMSRGNSRTHANSWVGYCRLSRTRITGFKRKRLGLPSEKLSSDVPRAPWRAIVLSEILAPLALAIIFVVAYLFVKSFPVEGAYQPGLLRIAVISLGPIVFNMALLIVLFLISLFLGPCVSLSLNSSAMDHGVDPYAIIIAQWLHQPVRSRDGCACSLRCRCRALRIL